MNKSLLLTAIVISFILLGCGSAVEVDQDGLQRQIDDLNSRVEYLENKVLDLKTDIIVINSAISVLETTDASNSSQLTTLNSTLASLQSQYLEVLQEMATLQGYKSITAVYDPCGAQGAWDEVFLRLSDGSYISSFSENKNGKNTRFAVLTDGTYQTTDGTECNFTVSGSGTVISNEHN